MEKLFIGLILHFVGDYLLQNDWMAQNKTKAFIPAMIHAMVYSLPLTYFLDLTTIGGLIIMWSHFFIDRYRLATYWIKFVNWNWNSNNFGFSDKTPVWLSTWLMIVIDNTWHILINSAVIYITFNL